MKTIRKFVALLLLLWTPLFFSGAAYASTQMELANAASHKVVEASHSCHDMNDESGISHQDMKKTSDSHCQHCGFCVSFVTPLNEMTTNIIPPIPSLAFNAMWVSSTHNISPDHRPPIDA